MFYNCFHQSISYVVTHRLCFSILGKPSSYYGISAAGFLSFSTILSSSKRVSFSLKTTFRDNKGLTTPQDFLLLHKYSSFRLPKNVILLFRKSVTHKFLFLTQLFILSSVLFSRKIFRSLNNCLWPFLIDESWLVSSSRPFFSWRACLFRITLHEQAKFLKLSSQLFPSASFCSNSSLKRPLLKYLQLR